MKKLYFVCAVLTLVAAHQATAATIIDFDSLAEGTIVDSQYAGVTVSSSDTAHLPMIFDSSAPSGGDNDLGTPHGHFGGPGVGFGGGSGQQGENSVGLGHVLIISEDNDSSDPDDNAQGGTLYFRFDAAATLHSIGILDFDTDEIGGTIRLFDDLIGGTELVSFNIGNLGNNSVQSIDLLGTTGVQRVEVMFPSSGAITDLTYSVASPTTLALLPMGLLVMLKKRTGAN